MIYLAIIVFNLISAVLLYLGLQLNLWPAFNIILFLFWLLSVNYFSEFILSRIFSLPKTLIRLLGIFLNIILFGFITNIFTSWLAFGNLSLLAALILTSLFLFFWFYSFRNIALKPHIYLGLNEGFWCFKNLFLILFLILSLAGFIVIFFSRTGGYLMSPWQILPISYWVIILTLFIITFSLIFSKKKVWLILASVIIFSFLIHSYLLVYSEGFGGDRWRHLGSENRILSGITYQPTLLTDDIWYQNILGLDIPRALIAGPKISYGLEWSLVLVVAKISKISIFIIDQYLIFILWSLFIPLLVFISALQIKSKNNYALLASSLTLVFYILQYYGSQTLPIGFGALCFIFFIACFLAHLKYGQNIILYFLISLAALSYFGYSLAFIILVISLVWAISLKLKPAKKYVIFIILSGSIFLMEVFSNFSHLKTEFNIKLIINDIFVRNNLLFFEKGQFLPAINNYSLALYLILSLIIGLVLIYSFYKILKEKKDTHVFLVGLIFILVINYLLSWIFLDGLHTLARRMNVFMVLLFVFSLAYSLNILVTTKTRAIWAVLIISFLGSLVYASGPVLEASVTKDDTLSMQYVWDQVYINPKKYCVLADSWSLLPLESYSAKEIEAGNFPSDFNYQQEARVKLFNDFIENPSLNLITKAMEITKTKSCFVVVDYNMINPEKVYQINNLLGEPKIFGQNLVWQYK